MKELYIIILALFINVSSNAQIDSTDNIDTYDYDTTLKGGYTISFMVDDSLQYLFLRKGNTVITELSSTSRGLPYKNLGYLVSDFEEYFVLAHSYGSGNPHSIELIKKTTGANILEKPSAWIDAIEEKEILLYSDDEMPTKKSKMTLFNAKTGRKESFSFPSDLLGLTEIFNRIQIEKVTDKQLIIKYETAKDSKTKMYSR